MVLNQMNEGRRTMSEDSVNDGVKAFTIQLPRSPSLERNRPEDDVHEEPSQAPEASTSPFVQSFSSSPSSFRPVDYESNPVSEEETDSLFDEPSEAEDSNGVMFSGPSSDFGLDGSVFSRPRPTSEFVLPPKEVINKLEEGVGIASGLNGPMDQESPISLQSGKPHVDEESQKPETAKGSEGKSLLRDGDDAGEPYGSSEVSNGVQWLPNVSLLSSNQGRAQETPEGYVVKPLEALKDEDQPEEVSEKAQAGVLVKEDSPSGRLEKDVLNEGETPTGDMKKVSDYDMVPCDKSTSGNNVIIDQGEEKNAKAPEVEVTATEIIDLESDDQEESVDAVYSVQRGPQEAVPIITSETAQPLEISYPETTKPLEMIASGSHQALLLELSRPLTPIEAQSNLEAGLVLELATLPAAEKDLTIHEDLEPSPEDVLRNRTPEQIQDPVALIEQSLITSVGTDFSRNGEPPLPLEETPRKQSPAAEVQSRPLSAGELPSTIADSFEDPPSKSQLLTPSTTQLSSFTSQPSFTPLQSVLDDDTLPTPRLTQGTTGDIVPPETLPLPEGLPGPEAMPPVKGTPTLIEKLKAMRRASNRSSGARPSDFSATAKWFAPKRSSGFVLDSEAESEAENSQERKEQVHVKPNTNGYSQTPDKPLAKLFIRSPRQGENFLSMNSSPQYSPHSPRPAPGFRSNFSYFVPLATLPSHFATTVDVLAIGISSTPITRSNSGTKDYNQTIYITDPSSTALHPTVTSAQIFRPNSRCFPHVEKGDALLLRDFKVQSFQKRLSLLSTESSAWATFHKGADVQILGPPVELGAEERGFARGLWDWWASLSEDARVGLQGAVPERKQYNGAPRRTKADGEDKIEVNVKKEEIEGLGVDLPGSQSKTKAPTQARSVGWEGEERSLSLDEVQESIEPPRRVLRARGVRGVAGRSTESPMKTARE